MKPGTTGIFASIVALSLLSTAQSASAQDQHSFISLVSKSHHVPFESESLGRRVRNFVLPDTAGKATGLSEFRDSRFLVVVFMGTQCPIGNAYVPDLNKLQKEFADKDVQVIGINPNLADSLEEVAKHKREYQIQFPVFKDAEQLTVDLFGARRTPEVFVLDRRRTIRYHGRIDDRIGYDYKRAKANRDDLIEAVKELVSKKEVSVKATKPLGCLITRKSSLKKKGTVTYTQQVSRIFEQRCNNCHHKGTAAPFSLTTYEEARQWTEMIKEVVTEQRMPPWDADKRFGKFSNDLRMTPEQIQTLVAWIDDGAPYGDKKDLPEPKQYVEGWTIPKPDKIFEMPKEYVVQANGVVEYKYFVTPTNFEEDKWIQAAEARPGNHAVVHHIIGYIVPKGERLDARGPAIAGYAPGEEPMVYPQGMGIKVPAGSNIVWQVHYTPTGKVEKDRSQIGIVFCDNPPKRPVYQEGIFQTRFMIPPKAENHRVRKTRKIDRDVELISLMPHMHLRGKSFKYVAHIPNQDSKILLDVPDYDFNWQHRYRFEKPVFLPKGTTIECIAHFDNSKENPANPDPSKTVYWGDQTFEEMMIGYFNYVGVEKSN